MNIKPVIKPVYVYIAILALSLSLASLFITSNNQNVTGAFTMADIAPKSFIYQEPSDTSPEAAQRALTQAEQDIKEMNDLNFISLFSKDALTEAKLAYAEKNYQKVFQLTQLINHIKKKKIDFYDRVRLLEIKKQTLEEKGIKGVADVNAIMQQAMNAFTLEQFDEADDFLTQANTKLADANKEATRLQILALTSKNFFLRYWWQNLIGLVILSIMAYFASRSVSKKMLERKISHLKLDLDQTQESIKKLQKECFISKAISVNTYKDRSAKYEEHIVEIKHTLPVLETQLKSKQETKNIFSNLFALFLKSVHPPKKINSPKQESKTNIIPSKKSNRKYLTKSNKNIAIKKSISSKPKKK